MSTTRLEAFSDGVFAIAATLLIIDVGVDESGRTLTRALLQGWRSYVAYAISFLLPAGLAPCSDSSILG